MFLNTYLLFIIFIYSLIVSVFLLLGLSVINIAVVITIIATDFSFCGGERG